MPRTDGVFTVADKLGSCKEKDEGETVVPNAPVAASGAEQQASGSVVANAETDGPKVQP